MTASANKLRLDTISKILKIDSSQKAKRKSETLGKQVSKVALSDLIAASHSKIPDFKLFLSDAENVQEFRQFLETQYCQENIDFYLACERYRKLKFGTDKVSKELVTFMATQIYNDFLDENAKQPINIDHDCLQRIKRLRRNPTVDLFNEAQLEIFNLMRSDCYPRFCKTWRVDRKTAKRILGEKLLNSSAQSSGIQASQQASYIHFDTTSTFDPTSSLISCSSSTRSSQRGCKRKLNLFQDDSESCSSECAYSKIGLPCRHQRTRHDNSSSTKECGVSDLIDQVDLGRLHKLPRSCIRRTPPPPPLVCTPQPTPMLPPKFEDKPRAPSPERIVEPKQRSKLPTPPIVRDRNCAYVGKVFHV